MIRWAAIVLLAAGCAAGQTTVSNLTPLNSILHEGWILTPDAVAKSEASLARDPDDIVVRTRLVSYYHQKMMAEPWRRHVLWMIENHPEAGLFRLGSAMTDLSERWTSLNQPGVYERAKAIWLRNAAGPKVPAVVLGNAATALAGADPEISLGLMKRARALEPGNAEWIHWLGQEYAVAVRLSFARDFRNMGWYAGPSGGITTRPYFFVPVPLADALKRELETSTDTSLMKAAGEALVGMTRVDLHTPNEEMTKSDAFGRALISKANQRASKN